MPSVDFGAEFPEMEVTVAICTWNRARLLGPTLAEMQNLRIFLGIDWELRVVNNASRIA